METMRSLSRRRFVAILLVLMLTMGAVSCGGGGTPNPKQWFVSPEGDDDNDCHTPLVACQTINAVLQRVVDGDVIYLAGGTYNETLAIDVSVTISGELAESEVVIDGDGWDRSVINMNNWEGDLDVTLAHMTITNGDAYSGGGLTMANADVLLDHVTVRGNYASETGGGIMVYPGSTLTIERSMIEMNEADGFDLQIGGGGIYNLGTLVVNNSVIQVNQAGDKGGGLYNAGNATLNAVIVTGNSTNGQEGGGAIYNNGTLAINGGEFQLNKDTSIGDGGAICNNGTATLDGLLVAFNSSKSNGGGIANQKAGTLTLTGSTLAHNEGDIGGGLSNNGGQITLREVTLEGNTSVYSGGAIMNYNGATLNLSNVTISGNSAGDLGGGIGNGGMDATIFAFNTTIAENNAANSYSHEAQAGAGFYHRGGLALFVNVLLADNPGSNCAGVPFQASGMNLSSDGTCEFDGYGNLWDLDPLLEPLADNGGRTETHALGAGSPAIDAGTEWLAPKTDQRDVSRPLDGDGDNVPRVDIGAVEFALSTMSGDADVEITPGTMSWNFEMFAGASCRSGPGTVYPILGYATAGETYIAAGRDEDMKWFQVRLNDDLLCWVSSDLGRLNGDPAWVLVQPAPATPTPVVPDPTDMPLPTILPVNPLPTLVSDPTDTPLPTILPINPLPTMLPINPLPTVMPACWTYTTLENCEAHGCKWLDGTCRPK